MANPAFEPTAHPALADLSGRLRELAGDSSYQAGRDYLRKGLVKQGTVAGTTAYATVSGSTDYRVSVAFGGEVKVTCTCPAHRRNKYCKHVVALCTALVERPGEFVAGEAPPEVQRPAARRVTRGAAKAAQPKPEELRAAGLETVDRLLAELADGGLMGLGPDKLALLAGAGELVRALKLRRLGNLLMTLQRAAEQDRRGLDERAFARLLADLCLTRQATGASLERVQSAEPSQTDAQLAEDLLGKTWRDDELEPVGGLELMELGHTRQDDGEFRIETSYLADLATGTLYAEKQITPARLRTDPKPRHRHRLLVDEGRLYPGDAPRRLKLQHVRRAPLAAADVERLLARLPESVAELRRVLVERAAVPFGSTGVEATFRPAALVARDGRVAAVDEEGQVVALEWPRKWRERLPALLPRAGRYALFGVLGVADTGNAGETGEIGLQLRCLSVVSPELAWEYGPVFDED